VFDHDNTMIYKIFRSAEWTDLQAKGQTLGAPIDLADGYIHFSTAAQAAETAAKHFAGQDDLWLAAIDETALAKNLKWEVSRGNALFPHLYRALHLSEIQWCVPLPLRDTGHDFPENLT
jgi:uncharacterized protein (DUF952 family)